MTRILHRNCKSLVKGFSLIIKAEKGEFYVSGYEKKKAASLEGRE